MLAVQKYLETHTLEQLIEEFSLKSDRKDNKVLLRYDMINSPMSSEIVQDCRGIILEVGTWRVLSLPFRKFFNYGEGHAANIDWNTAKVAEKIDGSCMTLWWNPHSNAWCVQTLGRMYADGNAHTDDRTFAELFWEYVPKGFIEDISQHEVNKYRCFTFELTTKYNRVVKGYDYQGLWFLSMRNLETLKEYNLGYVDSWVENYGLKRPEIFDLSDLESCIETARSFPPDEEGFVVFDEAYNRIKIKNPAYVAINHMRDGMGPKALIRIIQNDAGDDVLTYFPEWKEEYNNLKEKYCRLLSELYTLYDQNREIEVQKDFALAIKHHPCCGALFSLRAGKVQSIEESLAVMSETKLYDILMKGQEDVC